MTVTLSGFADEISPDLEEQCELLDSRLLELLRGPIPFQEPDVRVSAYTWLLRSADSAAFEHLCAALRGGSEPERVVTHCSRATRSGRANRWG